MNYETMVILRKAAIEIQEKANEMEDLIGSEIADNDKSKFKTSVFELEITKAVDAISGELQICALCLLETLN